LRQVALVARDCGQVAGELRRAFGWPPPFHDPGVGRFGLTNAVFAVGDTFVEVVAPAQPDTTAGRYLERRGGDGGYIDGGVAVITMNRPDRRNAFSPAMVSALGAVLAQVETDEAVGCVVLTGAGGAFCAGGDVKSMAAAPADGGDRAGRSLDARIYRQRLNQRATSGRLWNMPKPTIAAIGGPAAGAGLSLALACDLRYAVPEAVLTTAFAKVAFAGDYGGTWFLTRLVGSSKAKELYYFSERLSAEDARQLGIVNAIFAPADFEREVMERARRLAQGPSIAYGVVRD